MSIKLLLPIFTPMLFVGIAVHWIETGMKEDPADIIKTLTVMIQGILQMR